MLASTSTRLPTGPPDRRPRRSSAADADVDPQIGNGGAGRERRELAEQDRAVEEVGGEDLAGVVAELAEVEQLDRGAGGADRGLDPKPDTPIGSRCAAGRPPARSPITIRRASVVARGVP